MTDSRIAVVGSGISGLSAAWLLSRGHDVTLFEASDYLGGHTNTVDVELDDVTHPVDTGFLVYNDRTYPNLIALFQYLDVETAASDMSFSVRLEEEDIEWAGASIATVFAQKRNLVRPEFWSMLGDIIRFNRDATQLVASGAGLILHGRSIPRRRPVRASIPKLVPAADGGRDLVVPDRADACVPGSNLRPVLPQPRVAADSQPPPVAHCERGGSQLCAPALRVDSRISGWHRR